MKFGSLLLGLCEGFGVTLKLFALTLAIALPLGMVIALLAMSGFKPLAYLMKTLIWIVRGTPLLLQCVIVTFIPSYLFGLPNKDFATLLHLESIASLQFVFVLSAFVLNYSCYFAVIYQGGIQSISKGQYEAGQVLGMTRTQIFFRVTLMQVVRRITAPMSNEIITLVKDTALARALGVIEIISVAYDRVNRYVVLTPLLYAGLFYLAFSGILTLVFRYTEKKLSYYQV